MSGIRSYDIHETIYSNPKLVVYQGVRKSDQTPVVIKKLNRDYPTQIEITNFFKEFDLLKTLDFEGVPKPLESFRSDGETLIIFEDKVKGSSIQDIVHENPMEISLFLTSALKIVRTLEKIHNSGYFHKEIKPSNIIFNLESKALQIIDFTSATSHAFEPGKSFANIGFEESLAYISPEQTGRMNRTVDYRTDFYSLGITFYEMLTGGLPFEASDSVGWIHCHIAQTPKTLHQINSDIPEAISRIVEKLICKNAEDRYQSAFGLQCDLKECLNQWKQTTSIESFPLGKNDVSDHLNFPETLYGRENEIKEIMDAFQRISKGGVELILASGEAGIGKTSLFRGIRTKIIERGGYFLEGSFNHQKNNVPYLVLIQAFQELIRRILSESDEQLEQCKNKLLGVLTPNAQIIIDVIPEVELIIGAQIPPPQLPPQETENRFHRTFLNFINIFNSVDYPLTIFLDNMQHAGLVNIEILKRLLKSEGNKHLLILGAYQEKEMDLEAPFVTFLEYIKNSKTVSQCLSISNLNKYDITALIVDLIHSEADKILPLATIILKKTSGNPLFVNELLRTLYKEKLLQFNSVLRSWQWDLIKIEEKKVSDTIADLVIGRVEKLPKETYQLLEWASCIGKKFDIGILSYLCKKSHSKISHLLEPALFEGVLIPFIESDSYGNKEKWGSHLEGRGWRFLHDNIQQAIYEIIDEDQKKQIHLQIGFLLSKGPKNELEQQVDKITFHLNIAIDLIKDQNEKKQLAHWNLLAGKKAKASTAYIPASNYFDHAIQLLEPEDWKNSYPFVLELYNEAAENSYLATNFKRTHDLTSSIFNHAESILDKVEAYQTLMRVCTSKNQLRQAIEYALEILKMLGISLPAKPKSHHILLELFKTKARLLGKNIESLIDLPEMKDPYKLKAMQIMSSLGSIAYVGRPNLMPIAVLRLVQLSLQSGLSGYSAPGFAAYALIQCGVLGNIKAGNHFANLALAILEHTKLEEIKCKIPFIVESFSRHWVSHVRSLNEPLRKAYHIGMECGDFEFSGLSLFTAASVKLNAGVELVETNKDMLECFRIFSELKQTTILNLISSHLQMIENLIEPVKEPWHLHGNHYDSKKDLSRFLDSYDGVALFHVYLQKITLEYLFYRHKEAMTSLKMIEKYQEGAIGTYNYTLIAFYDSLIHLAAYKEGEQGKRALLNRVAKHQKKIKKWARHSPMNHQFKYLLVEAEKYRILNRKIKAMNFYEQSIQSAKEQQFLQFEALANELYGKFWLSQGKQQIAKTYLNEAKTLYDQWGAQSKILHLESEYPNLIIPTIPTKKKFHLIGGEKDNSASTDFTTAFSKHHDGRAILDMETVLKASQALVGEVVLENLFKKIMELLIENAGADRALLVLKNKTSGELTIEAENSVGNNDINILSSIPLKNTKQLSERTIRYAARTKKNVLLNSENRDPHFAEDPYIKEKGIKSLLAAPIIAQGELIGVIYLENSLTKDIFTSSRLEILAILTSQMSIALENALLYRTMEEKVIERTRSIKDLLDNTGQGFLSFDCEFRIQTQYSKRCESFFSHFKNGTRPIQLAGYSFLSLITDSSKKEDEYREILNFVFANPKKMDMLSDFLPKDITINKLCLSLEFSPIKDRTSGCIQRIMVIFTDITQEKKLRKRLEEDEQKKETILKIAKYRSIYLIFVRETRKKINELQDSLKEYINSDVIDELFRKVHTIKGGAAGFSLDQTVNTAHALEADLQNLDAINGKIDVPLITKIKQNVTKLEDTFHQEVEDFRELIPEEEWNEEISSYRINPKEIENIRDFMLKNMNAQKESEIHKNIELMCREPLFPVLRRWKVAAETLAEQLNRKIEVELTGGDLYIYRAPYNDFFDNFVHLIRNAIDHGIEDWMVRAMSGKPKTSKLKLIVRSEKDQLIFEVEDDGLGINSETLVQGLIEKKQITPEWAEMAREEDKVNLIFQSGASTSKSITDISGRGVGMGAIKNAVDKLQGTIKVQTKLNKGTRFTITLPHNCPTSPLQSDNRFCRKVFH